MTRLVALLAALAVAGCGGSTVTQAEQAAPEALGFPHRYVLRDTMCVIEQTGRCIDLFTDETHQARRGFTCQKPASIRWFCYLDNDPELCTPVDCRQIATSATSAFGSIVIECVTELPKATPYLD